MSFATSAATAIASTLAIEDEKLRLSIAASERERRRWARELHDETLQELGALNVMQESALQVDDAEAMRRALARSNRHVEGIIAGLQGLITELRPAALDQLGIAAAVEVLVERVQSRGALEVELDIDLAYDAGREPTRHTPELEATVYRRTSSSTPKRPGPESWSRKRVKRLRSRSRMTGSASTTRRPTTGSDSWG